MPQDKEYLRQWFKTPKGRYHQQKGAAGKRGVPWRLTFAEWWSIWEESGKWEERGKLRGQYVMARYGDTGPYERGNVRICTVGENTVENTSRLPARGFCTPEFREQLWTPEFRAKRAAEESARATGRTISEETRARMSSAKLGKVYSAESRSKMSAAQKRLKRKRDKLGRWSST